MMCGSAPAWRKKGEAMTGRSRVVSAVSIMLVLMSMGLFLSASAKKEKKVPQPKLISLDLATTEYVRILGGPPETVTMHSGFVVLAPGKSVGRHSTKNYEEALVVLEGEGNMMIVGGPTLGLKAGSVAYCPPRTEHDVVCTGSGKLKYVYIVANAE
jgi:quercetin dioxygenase-like cupin family protein